MTEPLLRDQRVLVVEDDYLIARAVEQGLQRAGAIVLGPVPSVAEAFAILETDKKIDAAVLDIKLGKQKVYPVVDALMAQGVRCVFATGNDAADVPYKYVDITRCEKPIDPACLVEALVAESQHFKLPRNQGNSDYIREQLLSLVALADANGNTLLAVKISEALDVID